MVVFLYAPLCFKAEPASRPSPSGGCAGLDPGSASKHRALKRKTGKQRTPLLSERNRGSRRPAYVKENPRPGYAVWETKTRDSRQRQLPTD